jgi:uncharacterized integral membrane protein (TIGR00698 family)
MSTSQATLVAPSPAGTTGAVYGVPFTSDTLLSLGCMEGLYGDIVGPPKAREIAARPTADVWPGYALAAALAVVAYVLHYLPIAPFSVPGPEGVRHPLSAAIIAILLGLMVRNLVALPRSVNAGCKRAIKTAIPPAIVLTGAGLNLASLTGVGFGALVVTVSCVAFAVTASYFIGRSLGLRRQTALLLGAGTGICGNSAIVAVAPLTDAEDEDVALSIGTINLVGLVAMLSWPAIGSALAMSDASFGVWTGASIHAVPQVVAAGFAFSADAGTMATLVKLVRVSLLAPLVFVFAFLYAKQRLAASAGEEAVRVRYARLVPWFVWGFLALAACNTLGLLPTLSFDLAVPLASATQPAHVAIGPLLTRTATLLLTIAMAAIGLELNIRQLAGVGARAIVVGLLSTAAVGGAGLILVRLLI